MQPLRRMERINMPEKAETVSSVANRRAEKQNGNIVRSPIDRDPTRSMIYDSSLELNAATSRIVRECKSP